MNVLNRSFGQREDLISWIAGGEVPHQYPGTGSAQHGTCNWLFSHPTYQSWFRSRESSRLVVFAPAGSGKTVLSSALFHHLHDSKRHTVKFDFSFNDPSQRTTLAALRALSLSLLELRDSVPDRVKQLYVTEATKQKSGMEKLETAKEIFKSILKTMTRVHIILDGLDECRDRNKNLMTILGEVLRTPTLGVVKWFLTSRPESEIRQPLLRFSVNELVAPVESLDADVRAVLLHRWPHERWVSSIDKVMSVSRGNFLWAIGILQALEQKYETITNEDIEYELAKFPVDLNSLYFRNLQRLTKRGSREQAFARKTFVYLVVAEQYLHLSEILQALSATFGHTNHSRVDLLTPSLIEDLCSSFVIFDRASQGCSKDPLLKFAHKTVHDFFVQEMEVADKPDQNERQKNDDHSVRETMQLGMHEASRSFLTTTKKAHQELGQACLQYLSLLRCDSITSVLNDSECAFAQYAAVFWHIHISSADLTPQLLDQVENFLDSPAFWNCILIQAHVESRLFAVYYEDDNRYTVSETTIIAPTHSAQSLHYGLPLPDWMTSRKAKDFYAFAAQWHRVLQKYPDKIHQCRMTEDWESRWPNIRSKMSERVQCRTINFVPPQSEHTSRVEAYLNPLDDEFERDPCMETTAQFDIHLKREQSSVRQTCESHASLTKNETLSDTASTGENPEQTTFRECHYSEKHHHLFCLKLLAVPTGSGLRMDLSVSVSEPSYTEDGRWSISRTLSERSLSYFTIESISSPLILTSWTADEMCAALPALSCIPKVVRLSYKSLLIPSDEDLAQFRTLQVPIVFPSSTLSQHASLQLAQQDNETEILNLNLWPKDSSTYNTNKRDVLFLHDPTFHGQCSRAKSDTLELKPIQMSWSLHRNLDWRYWDELADSQSDLVNQDLPALRGKRLVNAEKVSITVRSGLDWRRKAFLSC